MFVGCDQVHLWIRCTEASDGGMADHRAEDWLPSTRGIYVHKSYRYDDVTFNESPDNKWHKAQAGILLGRYADSEWYTHNRSQEYVYLDLKWGEVEV